jgi:hypothetical protein
MLFIKICRPIAASAALFATYGILVLDVSHFFFLFGSNARNLYKYLNQCLDQKSNGPFDSEQLAVQKVQVIKVQKVVNPNLSRKFYVKKRELVVNQRTHKEVAVWHGTRGNSPYVVAKEGLKMNRASSQSWVGKGLYGASDYRYSIRGYSHRMAFNEKGQFESAMYGNIRVLLLCQFLVSSQDVLGRIDQPQFNNYVVRKNACALVTHIVYFKIVV